MEHFTSSKQLMVATATTTLKRKDAPRGPRPRSLGPSAGPARDAGAEERVSKPKRPKKKAKFAKKRVEKEKAEDGGFALLARGEVRRQGVFVPIGNERTCLPDALHVAMKNAKPSIQVRQNDVRAALMGTVAADPTFQMAKTFVSQYGLDLQYERELNCPKALFERRHGSYLVQLQISTLAGTDYHYVAYLSQTGYVVDNERGAKVPMVVDTDRRSNKQALRVFRQLFPRATGIFMKSASRVSPIIWNTQAPPSLYDMFLELLDDCKISREEYIHIMNNQ